MQGQQHHNEHRLRRNDSYFEDIAEMLKMHIEVIPKRQKDDEKESRLLNFDTPGMTRQLKIMSGNIKTVRY